MDYTKLEENQLLKLAKDKDEKAVEELLKRYKFVPSSIARSYFLIGGAEEDLLQEGMIGLYRAINTYDDEKGSFKTFVYACVKNSILSTVKKSNSKKNKPLNEYVSLSGYVDGDSDKNSFIQDSQYGPEDMLLYKEAESELENKIISELSEAEYQIFKLYLAGLTYSQISQKLNKTIKSIDNSLQKLKKKIIKIINDN